MELKETLNLAIKNAHQGVRDNALGTQEHADAAQELNMFAQREIDRVKAFDQNVQAQQKLEADVEAMKIRAEIDRQRLEADKLKAEREAEIARQKLEADKLKAERDAEIEREKIEAEKQKAEREADVEQEKIKADRAKSTKDTFVRVVQLAGVVVVALGTLFADSDNFLGRGCNKGFNFISKIVKL